MGSEATKSDVEALAYEVTSFACCGALTSVHQAVGDRASKDAFLEAFLVHMRLLIEFIYGRPPKKPGDRTRSGKDIQPDHFVRSWNPVIPAEVDTWLVDADQRLVHLSRSRREPNVKWQIRTIAVTLLTEFDRFVATAISENSPWVPTLADASGTAWATLGISPPAPPAGPAPGDGP